MTEYGPNFFRKYLDILEATTGAQDAEAAEILAQKIAKAGNTAAGKNMQDTAMADVMQGGQTLNQTLGSKGAANLPGVTPQVQADARAAAAQLQQQQQAAMATPGAGVGAVLRGRKTSATMGSQPYGSKGEIDIGAQTELDKAQAQAKANQQRRAAAASQNQLNNQGGDYN